MAEAESAQKVCSFFLENKCKRKKNCPFAHPIIEVAPVVVEKAKVKKEVVEKPKKTPLELAVEEQNEQGERVRELKAKKAPKDQVDEAVKKLLECKNKVKALGGESGEKKDDKKGKGGKDEKKAAAPAAGGAGGDKKDKKKKGDDEEAAGDDEAAAAPAAAAEAKPEAKKAADKKPKEKPKKEEAAAEAAPAEAKAGKKDKAPKEKAAPAAEARKASNADEAKPASRKTSSADEVAAKGKPASRKTSNADDAAPKGKPASRKTSNADDVAPKGKPASRKTSNVDEVKGKAPRKESSANRDDEKALRASQRAPVDLNDPFLLKYKTFDDSPALGNTCPALTSLKFLGDAKAPNKDAPLAVLFWSVYYTGGYKFLPLYTDLQRAFKGKLQVLGVSVDPSIEAPKKWVEDPEKKFSKGEFPTGIPLAFDEGKKVYESFRDLLQNTLNIPHLFLVDKKGKIVWHQDHSQIGGTCYDWMDMIERQVAALLAGKPLESLGKAPVEEDDAGDAAVSNSFDPNDLF